MEDLKKIQEFFSKPLKENTTSWPKEVPSRHGDIIFRLVKVMPDRAKYELIDAETGKTWEIGGRVYGTVNQLKASAEDTIKPQRGRQSSQFESVNEELNLSNYGKVTPPKGGASLVGKYNSIQGKSKYDTVIFDYQEGSDKPYGIVQVKGHGIYGSDLLKRLGLRQTQSWTAGVDEYIHDGNLTPVYISEDDFKALLDFWSGGLDREAKAQADFYRSRGNTSGTIDEAKVDYDFSERELIRVLRQLKRGASTEVDMIKAFTKALGRDLTKDELFEASLGSTKSQSLANAINSAMLQIDDSMSYTDFANAVASILIDEYGTHNFTPFMEVLHARLGMNEATEESVNENALLKQAKLSSAEYQKAKKLKDFNKDDYKWNPGESLYIKLNETDDQAIAEASKKEYDALLDKEHELTSAYMKDKTDANWKKLSDIRKKGKKLEKELEDQGLLEASKTFGHSSDEKKKSIAQTLAETIKLGEGVIEEELCPKGKAYIKRRKAAGEKSSAYLSGRAVKVCKGQMSGRKKRKSKKK